ncbi:hypothetical protein D3C71_1838850 [compost metagenome]
MVQMGMGQHNGVQVANRQLERIPVMQAQLFIALEQAAIDQHMLAFILQQIFAARDRASRTEKCHSHGRLLEHS